jgi:Fe(3+) dicitrate transport protein
MESTERGDGLLCKRQSAFFGVSVIDDVRSLRPFRDLLSLMRSLFPVTGSASARRGRYPVNVRIPFLIALCLMLLVPALRATENLERLSVYGSRDRRLTEPSSTTILSKEWLEAYKYSDINRVLKTVPGIQVQEEDGFGLRPNIGMRGAHPHRSRKVLFMEDGIPIGPAPYAAPAAYYVPSLLRTEGIEVTKGSSSVRYGPQTIGGVVNLLSPDFPDEDLSASGEVAVGSFNLQKARLSLGGQSGAWSWLVLGARLQTDGYKTLPNDQKTGFNKRDLLTKIRYRFTDEQSLGLKLGWSDELSQETYLGLNRSDFEADPYQRYTASERDEMENWHRQQALDYVVVTDRLLLRLTLYRHRFERLWFRFNGFGDRGIDVRKVLAQPLGQNQHLYDVLKGTDDTLGSEDQIVMASNDRGYLSQGVNWEGEYRIQTDEGLHSHEFAWGIRLHEDSIQRHHGEQRLAMMDGRLDDSGSAIIPTTLNTDTANAQSFYLMDTYRYRNLRLTLGVRHEAVLLKRDDRTESGQDDRHVRRDATMPGLGAFYKLGEGFGVLAGVYRGIALAGLDDEAQGQHEESWNYEAGFRLIQGAAQIDLIGFYNDYANIKGTCSFSSGCTADSLDKTFDGGRATIYGLELASSYGETWGEFYWPLSVQYTYTQASFGDDFFSALPDWGLGAVKSGDPLPYIPQHQLGAQVGVRWRQVQFNLTAKRQSQMFDQSVAEGREVLSASTVVDAALSYFPSQDWELYLNGDNLFDDRTIVSLRPFGARPGKPRSYTMGVKARF